MRVGLDDNPALAEVIRGGMLECVHRGRLVVTAPDGSVRWAVGDVDALMYPRSSLKPLQAVAMLRLGLDLDGRLLALAAASHNGEPDHLTAVREMLAGAGLDESALQNTPDTPIDPAAHQAWLAAGHPKSSLAQNCSGKHAAMLRTTVRIGADTSSYRDLDHPVQQAIAETITEFTGAADLPTVDGCGAPLFAVPLSGLAKAFGRIAAAGQGHEAAMAQAYREHPWYASGTGRHDRVLHQAVPGLICTGGAEGCFALGLADGTGVALKFDDGNPRGILPVVSRLLTALGVPGLDEHHTSPVLGHGEVVGRVQMVQSVADEASRAAR
ncbi:asparaginase [Aestuariimicrobium ganziense]|uniref:asparaginase n=1 Tax=Aestuariimicrobium ganziense TaxID=2773677 RepID=UPI002E2A3AA1|nr:asparaginase [Aestuariimicrobium ganziense]